VDHRFATSKVPITWAVAAPAARLATGLGGELAILFGAIVVVTWTTVIMPMLCVVHPAARVASVPPGKRIVVPPIGILLALLPESSSSQPRSAAR
jgi:hypothetical protein